MTPFDHIVHYGDASTSKVIFNSLKTFPKLQHITAILLKADGQYHIFMFYMLREIFPSI